MEAAGAPVELIEQQRLNYTEAAVIEILEVCHPALEWFFQVYDLLRWNQHFCLGLDVVAVEADARMRGINIDKDDYQRLRTLVEHYSQAINEERT
ncbi:hypothetical protein [Pseudidiomarina aestuarii]|uniref:hypothetical protein n=1 Tax=Pseudidiomarina aestuarii TaxID=624146 RepID=UPI003A985F91